jgi:hypothetical protein
MPKGEKLLYQDYRQDLHGLGTSIRVLSFLYRLCSFMVILCWTYVVWSWLNYVVLFCVRLCATMCLGYYMWDMDSGIILLRLGSSILGMIYLDHLYWVWFLKLKSLLIMSHTMQLLGGNICCCLLPIYLHDSTHLGGALNLVVCICIQIHTTYMHTFRGSFSLSYESCGTYTYIVKFISQIRVLSSNTKKGEIERTSSYNHVLCVSWQHLR